MNLTIAETTKTSLPVPRQKFGKAEVFYPETDGKPMGETDLHIILITELFNILKTHFHHSSDIKVIANMMFYYEEGNPRRCISPDVMVIKGVGKHTRRVYKLWEEKVPDVIFEISSRETWRDDLQKKYTLYENMGVKEYYVFDPEYKYLPEPLLAHHLKGDSFQPIKVKKGRVFSPALNLEIVDTGETLRLFNPETNEFLLTHQEYAEKLTTTEQEIEKLRAELAKLKKQK